MEPKNTDTRVVFTTVTNTADGQVWLFSLFSQIRETVKRYRNPPPPVPTTAAPDPDAGGLLIEQPSTLGSTLASIRGMIEDWRNPRAYAVQPAPVQEMWGGKRYKTQMVSFAAYAALLTLLYAMPRVVNGANTGDETVIGITLMIPDRVLLLETPKPPKPVENARPQPPTNPRPSVISGGGEAPGRSAETPAPATPAPPAAGGGGGGGREADTDASKGLPPVFRDKQLVPPTITPMNPDPLLVAAQSLVAWNAQPYRLDLINPPNIGDPFGAPTAPPSPGPGTGGGIGPGRGRGVGEGVGPGEGPGSRGGKGGGSEGYLANDVGASCRNCGNGGGDPTKVVGGGVRPPVPVFRPNPAYSEDARKNKVTGQVLLELVVREDGSVEDVKLLRSLGHGLDESAIATVRTWKFKPGTEDGKPVPVRVTMEVTFRLL